MLIAGSASARDMDLVFYPNIYCGQGGTLALDSEVGTLLNCKYQNECDNDELKSVFIAASVKPGTVIRVWDDPNGSTRDDWATITVRKVEARNWGGRGVGVCVTSFEQQRSGPEYSISYRRVNGLNGKVSRVAITPAR